MYVKLGNGFMRTLILSEEIRKKSLWQESLQVLIYIGTNFGMYIAEDGKFLQERSMTSSLFPKQSYLCVVFLKYEIRTLF